MTLAQLSLLLAEHAEANDPGDGDEPTRTRPAKPTGTAMDLAALAGMQLGG